MARKPSNPEAGNGAEKQKRTRGPRVERLTAEELNRFAEHIAAGYQQMRLDPAVSDETLAAEWALLEKVRRIRGPLPETTE